MFFSFFSNGSKLWKTAQVGRSSRSLPIMRALCLTVLQSIESTSKNSDTRTNYVTRKLEATYTTKHLKKENIIKQYILLFTNCLCIDQSENLVCLFINSKRLPSSMYVFAKLEENSKWDEIGRQIGGKWIHNLHVFELIDATLGIAFANLTKRLVLVTTLTNVFPMNFIHNSFLRFIA